MRAHRSALLTLALLTGCVAQPPLQTPADATAVGLAWGQRQQQLTAIGGFELSGRVAVKGGGLSGALRWQQQAEHYRLRIAGPFGAGALAVEGTPAQATIKGKDIDLVTAEPARVLAERTGWRLPLEALRWWVLGLPAPADDLSPQPSVALDANGRATQIQQAGWTLRYSDYRETTQPALPYRIEAVQPTANGEWMATVIVDTVGLSP